MFRRKNNKIKRITNLTNMNKQNVIIILSPLFVKKDYILVQYKWLNVKQEQIRVFNVNMMHSLEIGVYGIIGNQKKRVKKMENIINKEELKKHITEIIQVEMNKMGLLRFIRDITKSEVQSYLTKDKQ